mmetsp:Transcript_67282/g.162605  ORF Transcript_67282/g.162605 Transcript_67282/m.162605 type:complete len:91 (+) Transcript_67282:486-758(+)
MAGRRKLMGARCWHQALERLRAPPTHAATQAHTCALPMAFCLGAVLLASLLAGAAAYLYFGEALQGTSTRRPSTRGSSERYQGTTGIEEL